jgi:hypothetical protein
MREDLIMAEVSTFFAERVFGSRRREMFLASLTQVDDAVHRHRQAGLERANRAVAEITRKQANVLRQVEDLTQVTIRVHYAINEATLSIILPSWPLVAALWSATCSGER